MEWECEDWVLSEKETAVVKAVEEWEEVCGGGDEAVGGGDWVVSGGDGNGFGESGSGMNSGWEESGGEGFEGVG